MKKLRDEVNRLTELYDEAFLIVAVVEAKNERLRTMLAKCAQAMADAAEKEGA
jgi:hypothetical protein